MSLGRVCLVSHLCQITRRKLGYFVFYENFKFQASSDVDLGRSRSIVCHLSVPSTFDAAA